MPTSANIRIARNTAVIYIRMAVTIAVGLITSRLVLQALGASDVGIYSAVGSTVALISFITGALTATTVRFMNFEMGKAGDTNRMFNVCHVIHISGAALLFILLESIGLWYIHTKLNVPPGKEGDAMFVFQVSTVVACLGIANVPFQSLFNVHERFTTVAVVDIVNALVKLGLVIGLLYWKGNGLRLYAVFMSVTTWISFIVYHWLCRVHWPDIIRWKPVRGRKAYREVLVFANYNLLSSASMIARSQGSNMLINAFFGTTVNAAYFYAGTVQNYVNQFIANIDTAAAPQITQNIGAGNVDRSVALAERVCRICILLFLLLFFPLWSELDFILNAWLGADRIPEGTALMCRWTLLVAAASATSAGLTQLINAYGRVKWYKIEFSVLYLGCLLAGWLLYRAGFPAYTIIVCFVGADLLSRVIQLILLRCQFGFDVRRFLQEAYLRPALAAVILIGYLFLYRLLPLETAGAKVGGIALTLFVTAGVLVHVGLKFSERRDIRKYVGRKWHEWQLDHHHDRVVQQEWEKRFGHPIDWNDPKDLNEKIQWLMCFSDTSAWTRLSDKVRVRDYVTEKGLGDLLVPLLGTWRHSADIPWDTLPDKFVLKCNHDSGSTHIVDANTNRQAVGLALDEALREKYGYRHGEMHYNGIAPCILAEEFLDSGEAAPVDYKVWCFDGKPYCIWACYGRTAEHVYVNVYDLDWNPRPEASVFTFHYRDGGSSLPKPETLPQMLEAAAKLSEGFPEVRVDFYEVRGKLYFGEMTFASLMGMMDFYTDAFLQELGDQVKLPRR